MKIIKQSWEFINCPNGEDLLKQIEFIGRCCYKSEEKITTDSAKVFVKKLIDSKHHAMIEHGSISVKMITDRGVTHEIVRHRVASYAQESTRYCNYSKDKFGNEITVILPVDYDWDIHGVLTDLDLVQYETWKEAMKHSEKSYMTLLRDGASPQLARSVLPNSLKTEIVMTANPREWRHFFTLRCSNAAHPQMKELARSMLTGFQRDIPILFDDISY